MNDAHRPVRGLRHEDEMSTRPREERERRRGEDGSPLAPRAYLEASLLLLLAEAPAHGYDLGEGLAAVGSHSNDFGRVYRALRDMERDGLVRSWWEGANRGPARRMYHLTEKGGDRLADSAALVHRAWSQLGAYLERWGRLDRPVVNAADRRERSPVGSLAAT